jgi:monofunctional biosynthetic peptidoglycan transglycosylase
MIPLVGFHFSGGVSMAEEPTEMVEFTKKGEERNWWCVNDGVMGGLSDSEFVVSDEGTGVFSGTVSLANNGGFASVRRAATHYGLEEQVGIRLMVRGDGRPYQFRIRTDDNFDGVAYQAIFETLKGEWTTVDLLFSDFRPSYRGRQVPGAPPLNPADIRQIGFLIADKQEGPFRLEIERIEAISPQRDQGSLMDDII